MGAEGDDNLDNDSAGDLLHAISKELTDRILELLVHRRAHEYDDEEIAELFVRIETVFAFHARRMLAVAPDPQKLRELVDPFVTRWEAYHRAAGHDPPAKRQATMDTTFQELYRVSIEVVQERWMMTPVEGGLDITSDADHANHACV